MKKGIGPQREGGGEEMEIERGREMETERERKREEKVRGIEIERE